MSSLPKLLSSSADRALSSAEADADDEPV